MLVVDDDQDTREAVAYVLELEGYRVCSAALGGEALDALGKMRELPRLVLVDVVMPGMSGLDVIHQMRRTPKLARVPVVVMTGRSPLPAEDEALDVADWLCKPAAIDQLLDIVGRFAPHV